MSEVKPLDINKYDVFWNESEIREKMKEAALKDSFEPVFVEIFVKEKQFPFETHKYKFEMKFTGESFVWN